MQQPGDVANIIDGPDEKAREILMESAMDMSFMPKGASETPHGNHRAPASPTARKPRRSLTPSSVMEDVPLSSPAPSAMPEEVRPGVIPRHDSEKTQVGDITSEKPDSLSQCDTIEVNSSSGPSNSKSNSMQTKEPYDLESQISAGSEDNSPIEEVRAIVPGRFSCMSLPYLVLRTIIDEL